MSTEAGRLIDMKQRRKYLRTRYKVMLAEAAHAPKPYTDRWSDPDDNPFFDKELTVYEHIQERLREAKRDLDEIEASFAFAYRHIHPRA